MEEDYDSLFKTTANAKLISDPLGRKVLIAEKRLKKPSEFAGEIKECPFCPERIDLSAPKTLYAYPSLEDWRIRIIPNKYPMTSHNYVIVHRKHKDGFEREGYLLELKQASLFLSKLGKKLGKEPFIFKNKGFLSGASLSHSHEQAFFLESIVKEDKVKELKEYIEKHLSPSSPYNINEFSFSPPSSIQKYEVWVVLNGTTIENSSGWERVSFIYRALKKLLGEFDYNAFLYHSSKGLFPPFFVLLPRLSIVGGAELATCVFVNPLNPEHAAKEIKQALLSL